MKTDSTTYKISFDCFQATDVSTGEEFALKKMICGDKESYEIARKEARVMQQLAPHPNIVQLHATSEVQGSGGTEVYFLMDLCTGGTLYNIMERFEKKRHRTAALAKFCSNLSL